ncbi:hypothetical protein [Methanococcoides methylutens]|nr:hypothetical protein [Methanococcoides methylutens]
MKGFDDAYSVRKAVFIDEHAIPKEIEYVWMLRKGQIDNLIIS